MGSTHPDTTMCTAHHLLGAAGFIVLLAVGIHAGGTGECNENHGVCMKTYEFLRVEGDPFCKQLDQIDLSKKQLERECGDEKAICCKHDKVSKLSKRQCTKTTKKCEKQGGVCSNDCDTIERDLCKGASCKCCIQKQKTCKPKKDYEELNGFCVEKRKYCTKAGGTHIRNGCDCKKDKDGKTHFCYKKEEKFHWSYTGDGAPEFWKDHFPLCGLDSQSPINIVSADAVALSAKPFEFTLYDDKPNSMTLVNNGHSVTSYWNDAKKPFVAGGGLTSEYIVAQFHFHWGSVSTQGSEHTIDDKMYPIELHIVHYKSDYGSLGEAVKYEDGLAVLGIMFEVGAENEALKPIVEGIPSVVNADDEAEISFDMPLNVFLPENTDSFYRYQGSLTTPSCNEVVVWTVFKEPLKLSEDQLDVFRTLLDSKDKPIVDNYRPVQPLNGRTISTFDG